MPVERQCGASWVKERSGFDVLPLLGEKGEQLNDEALTAYWLSPTQRDAQKLETSPNGCVAVPKSTEAGLILIGRKSTGSLSSFVRKDEVQRLQLQEKSQLKLNISCPTGGIFSSSVAQVQVQFTLNGQALTPEQAGQVLRLYKIDLHFNRVNGTKPVASFGLADWTRFDEAPALRLFDRSQASDTGTNAVNVVQLLTEPGSYFATLEWSDVLGARPPLDSPALCPIEIDQQAPHAPGVNLPLRGDALELLEGGRIPLSVNADAEVYYQISRIAAQELYKKWSALSPEEQAEEKFQTGSLAPVERPGLYLLRAYAQDKAGNRSAMYEQAVNVVDRALNDGSLPDGWQILQLQGNSRAVAVGPQWNGTAHVLAWAPLDGGVNQRIQPTSLTIRPYPNQLLAWQSIRSVKGLFGFGQPDSEQICFYNKPIYAGVIEVSKARMQCFGWSNGQWQDLHDQELVLSENDELIPVDLDSDKILDFVVHDSALGVTRPMAFREGKLGPMANFVMGNLEPFGSTRGQTIMTLRQRPEGAREGQLFLRLDPGSSSAVCYGIPDWGGTIHEDSKDRGIGQLSTPSMGLKHPLAEQSYFFQGLRTNSIRASRGPDFSGKSRSEVIYSWSDELRRLSVWSYEGCSRVYQEINSNGLPDLYGRRASWFVLDQKGARVFKVLVYPLSSIMAEHLELYRYTAQGWEFENFVENPAALLQKKPESDPNLQSSQPNTIEAGWLDLSEAPRAWGALSVTQGKPLPIQIKPGFVAYHRWTLLQKNKEPRTSTWRSGPFPYPHRVGTFLFELWVGRPSDPNPSQETPPQLRRVVGVVPPLIQSRAVMPGLSALVQTGTTLNKVTPITWTSRPGYVQWTVETLEAVSRTSIVELKQPWDLDPQLSFFAHQDLATLVGRLGLTTDSSESLCYIRKNKRGQAPAAENFVCLGQVDGNWQWLVEHGTADVSDDQDVQTLEISSPDTGVTTHILTAVAGKQETRIGRWDPVNQTFQFAPLQCNNKAVSTFPCWSNLTTPPYPIVVREPNATSDTVMFSFPYEIFSYWGGGLKLCDGLSLTGDFYRISSGRCGGVSARIANPFHTPWLGTEFKDGRLIYGSRYLQTQIITAHKATGSQFHKYGSPDYEGILPQRVAKPCGNSSICFFQENEEIPNLSFLAMNAEVQTYTLRNGHDAAQQEFEIMVTTPRDASLGHKVFRRSCPNWQCPWEPLVTLPAGDDP